MKTLEEKKDHKIKVMKSIVERLEKRTKTPLGASWQSIEAMNDDLFWCEVMAKDARCGELPLISHVTAAKLALAIASRMPLDTEGARLRFMREAIENVFLKYPNGVKLQ